MGAKGALVCLCGREMSPVILCDGKGWWLYATCFEHPGMAKPSTASVPLPASLAPPVIALGSTP